MTSSTSASNTYTRDVVMTGSTALAGERYVDSSVQNVAKIPIFTYCRCLELNCAYCYLDREDLRSGKLILDLQNDTARRNIYKSTNLAFSKVSKTQ